MLDELASSVHATLNLFTTEESKAGEKCPNLDKKEFQPRRLSSHGTRGSQHGSDVDYKPGMGVWKSSMDDIPGMAELNLADAKGWEQAKGSSPGRPNISSSTDARSEGKDAKGDGARHRAISTEVERSNLHPDVHVSDLLVAVDAKSETGSSLPVGYSRSKSTEQLSLPTMSPIPQALSIPPTWEPQSSFCYPVSEMPTKLLVPDNLDMSSFERVQHFADGSNANVFRAYLNQQPCIIKMIRQEVQHDPVAVHEFDCEHGMLVRFSHPNIIKVVGAGRSPRRFIVLEYLANGSLFSALASNVNKGSTMFSKHKLTFGWPNLIAKSKDLADAFDYLHRRCCDGASVLHRDLKPDNVGFTADGTLKLFDFGLCTVVQKRRHENEAYDMTGNTGSLRYMAPEVALRKPYSGMFVLKL